MKAKRIDILLDRLGRLAHRREMEGIYTDADLIEEAVAVIVALTREAPDVSRHNPDDTTRGDL